MHAEQNKLIEKALQEQWYHSIELIPGKYTKGYNFKNIALTRSLLRKCDVRNANCLDVGAVDFLITLLLQRRGAKNILAYDRIDNTHRAELLRKIFNLDFGYICGLKLTDLPKIIEQQKMPPFDLVVFSGVLYHMFDPLGGLASIRGLVRNGGLLILETSAVFEDEMVMHFNAGGRFYPRTNYWQISVKLLDYLLRFLRLAPLDCLYIHQDKNKNFGRIGVVCRAMDCVISGKDDWWMKQSDMGLFDIDFQEFLNWDFVKIENSKDIHFAAANNLIYHVDTNTVDLFKSIKNTECLAITDPDKQTRLSLNAKW